MKIVGLITVFVLATGSAWAQKTIDWMSMDEALAKQKEHPKKIMMDAYTDWCGPCKMMDKKTFHNPDVVAYVNDHFYAVKFNAEGRDTVHYNDYTYTNPKYDPERKGKRNHPHLFTRYLKIQGYPSVVFFDEDGNLIAPVMGYRKPQELEVYLKMVASNDYKEITDKKAWTDYRKNFKHTFKK